MEQWTAQISVGDYLPMAKIAPPRRRAAPPPPQRPVNRTLYIREWLEFLGKTQRWLADESGVSEGLLSQYSSGKRGYSAERRELLERALGLNPGQLHQKPGERRLLDLVNSLTAEQQGLAINLLEALKRS